MNKNIKKGLRVKIDNYYKKGGTSIGDNNFLYHYTNVSVLALILKDKKIKFNPLPVLDDLQEQEIKDEQAYGKYCFTSSWTESEIESIPMWNMYTKMDSGIRIKLPIYPFKEYIVNSSDIPNFNNKDFDKKTDTTQQLFDKDIYSKNGFFPVTLYQQGILYEVKYTKNHEKLKPQIKVVEPEETILYFDSLGIYKSEHWHFQKEWRYNLYFLPCSYEEFISSMYKWRDYEDDFGFQNILEKIEKCQELPFACQYLELRDDALNQMEILLSPKISDGNKYIVDLLVKEHNVNIKIIPSELTGKLN